MMHKALKIIAMLSLGLLILPSLLFLAGKLSLNQVKLLMLIATIIWFVSAALGMIYANKTKQRDG